MQNSDFILGWLCICYQHFSINFQCTKVSWARYWYDCLLMLVYYAFFFLLFFCGKQKGSSWPLYSNLLIIIFLFLQILRLFSESAASISVLKVDLADAKKLLGARNKQLHQLWYRSVTLRHIIALLDQVEGIAKVGLFIFQVYILYKIHLVNILSRWWL